ncbi:MAG: hypothetical protein RIR11_3949, partial [Bacteroidota bacterium]
EVDSTRLIGDDRVVPKKMRRNLNNYKDCAVIGNPRLRCVAAGDFFR